MIKALFLVASAALVLASPHTHSHEHQHEEVVKKAIVKLEGNGVSGVVTFSEEADGLVHITGKVVGMPEGEYGFHIHEKGNIADGCEGTLDHFNPDGHDHGHPTAAERHAGDLGNLKFDKNKVSIVDLKDHIIKLSGRYSIIGRGVVLREQADDFGLGEHHDSKVHGHSGARVACGVIGIA